ncbi:uncharacterized protein LOC132162294 [Corylus avellana]|uniref:uncharacterized protein LOC132162294 n=1 Tax=Corylus avellana TaxID=13451 RepID=UPI00286A5C58|nr:uncharacterized protein LOC132162294 [Corylus avellana]
MESLPVEIWLKIFCFLDYQNLAIAHQVCRKWKGVASDNNLWSNLFKERWGEDHAMFYAPVGSKSWKDVYEVQDRCHRVGLGLKIIREGGDYYLVHQGEIQRYLGSRSQRKGTSSCTLNTKREFNDEESQEEESRRGILDKILFFIGDLEVASTDAKRCREL